MSLPLYIRATFSPKKAGDLRPSCPPIGFRGVWESSHIIDDGEYAGQREWIPPAGGPWLPDCDLVDREPASMADFYGACEALRAAGVN